jgi:hypothetical protein
MTSPWPRGGRSAAMLLFLGVLHLFVLLNMWGLMGDQVANGAAVASLIPLVLAGSYLLTRIRHPLSWMDIAVTIYAAFCAGSVLLYVQPGNPSSPGAYVYGIYYFLLPMTCYYAVRGIARSEHKSILAGLVLINAFVIAYGIFLHLSRPAFYQAFVMQMLASKGYSQSWQYFARLQSYLGSTTTGYLSATSIVLVTLTGQRLRRWMVVLVPLFIAGAALSLERGSLLGCALALGYVFFLRRGEAGRKVLIVGLLVGGAVYVAVRYADEISLFRSSLEARVTTDLVQGTSNLLEERGYGPGLRYLTRFPLGVGLGGTSSAAASAGLAHQGQVVDANFMRIAADLGVVGLLVFLGVLATAAWTAYRSRHRAAWLTLLCIHCGIMLSTNIFDSYYVSQSFWILLAIMDGDRAPVAVPAAAAIRRAPTLALEPLGPESYP